jgi:hypothetical protein
VSMISTAGLGFAISWFLHSTFLAGGLIGQYYTINGTIIQYNNKFPPDDGTSVPVLCSPEHFFALQLLRTVRGTSLASCR